MKILFLNPPTGHTIPEYPREDHNDESYIGAEDFGAFPPLGILYVLTYLEENTNGHEIFFKDCVAEKIRQHDLKKVIEEIKPDIVGITSFTIAMVDVCMAARTIREVVPHAHICLGGHHPIAFPEEAAELPEFDSIVVGEGEQAFTELVNCLEANKPITHITGVYTTESMRKWKGNQITDKRFLKTVSVPPAYIDKLDSLPFPNRKYISHINYNSVVGVSNKLATILSTRGCPYLCTFCDVPYKKYRTRSIESVVDEIEVCLEMGYDEFHFYDDLFNITSGKVIKFCDEIEKRNLKFTWDFRGRANVVTKESLIRAKKAGCRMISFGVETGSNEGLKELKKGTTVEKITQVFKWCREVGIMTIADYIIGFPFEKTREDVIKNLDYLTLLDPDYAQIGILMLLPNTPLFDEGVRKGLVDEDKWKNFSKNPTLDFRIDHWTEHLSLNELVDLQAQGFKKFYFRPKYIFRSIFQTRSLYEFKTKAAAAVKLALG